MKRRSNRKRSQRQENRLRKELGGRLQPGSGSVAAYKGDILGALDGRVMVEAKTTAARQYTMKLDTLEKMERDAQGTRCSPALVLTFESAKRDFVVMSKEDFLELVEGGANGK